MGDIKGDQNRNELDNFNNAHCTLTSIWREGWKTHDEIEKKRNRKAKGEITKKKRMRSDIINTPSLKLVTNYHILSGMGAVGRIPILITIQQV